VVRQAVVAAALRTFALLGALAFAAAPAGSAVAARDRGARPAAPDVAVASVSVPRSVVAGVPFQADVALRLRTGTTAAAVVTVGAPGLKRVAVRTQVWPGRATHAVVQLTVPRGGSYDLVASAAVARDPAASNNVARATVAAADFALARTLVPGAPFAGFGAQFNQHVYAQLSRDAGVADENLGDMEQKAIALGPQLVRIFFSRLAFDDPDRMQSFVRTAQLAQRAGATINVTYQSMTGDAELSMPAFGHVLADLVLNRGVTNLRWVTIQNEVNSTKTTMDQYDRMYRLLDATLVADGVRDRIRFMGGDLVEQTSPLGQTQGDWFRFMAERMNDVLDAYSVHVYWNYWGRAKATSRLKTIRKIVDALPAETRKPVYVTEFGVRGSRPVGDAGPGSWDDGSPLENTNVSAFQQAWFALQAARMGFAGVVKWDAYFGRYDLRPQAFGLIGPPGEGWPLRPGYNALRLLTRATKPGWTLAPVDGVSGSRLVTAFAGQPGELTLFGLDTAGARLNTVSGTTVTYAIAGLPPGARFNLAIWNNDGSGTVAPVAGVTIDASGVATFAVPLQAVFALTTLPL